MILCDIINKDKNLYEEDCPDIISLKEIIFHSIID